MFKRSSLFFVLFGLISIFNFTASAQETESAANSALTEAKLPSGAVRILPGSVPAEINQGLEKIVAAGEGKIVQGDSEVLAWTGAGYKKSNAANLMKQIQSNLQAKGWSYETGEKTDEVTVFSALRETPKKQGVLGFYVMSDDAMVLAWTEILPAGGSKNTVENDSPKSEPIKQSPLQNQNSSRSSNSSSIVGEWHNGRVSMMQDKNLITGQMTASNGSTFTYKFFADGRFEYVGYIKSTMYGCTTDLFNDKRGRYEISGSQITFVPSKNYWKNTYSCSPSSNKERDYVLERETYEFRTKTDEYGKTSICLANAKGESCYQREER
jgi:hypothetical protein